MFPLVFSATFLAAVVTASAPAVAQAPVKESTPRLPVPSGPRDPADPKVAVPAVSYASAFARYRGNAEAEVGSWREHNSTVGRIGGWRTYGKEAAEPQQPGQAAGSARPDPSPGTAGTKQHGHKP